MGFHRRHRLRHRHRPTVISWTLTASGANVQTATPECSCRRHIRTAQIRYAERHHTRATTLLNDRWKRIRIHRLGGSTFQYARRSFVRREHHPSRRWATAAGFSKSATASDSIRHCSCTQQLPRLYPSQTANTRRYRERMPSAPRSGAAHFLQTLDGQHSEHHRRGSQASNTRLRLA